MAKDKDLEPISEPTVQPVVLSSVQVQEVILIKPDYNETDSLGGLINRINLICEEKAVTSVQFITESGGGIKSAIVIVKYAD